LVLAKLEATGFSSGTKYTPYIHKDGKTEDFTDTAAFLKHLLGMSPRTGVGTALMGSSIGQVIGFPGAEDYLAAKLPDLGDYFAALAEKLSTPHEH
jgi:hypothetical protein